MREPENICAVESLGIDLMGFIFWDRSARSVTVRPDYLPAKAKRVGVFVDEDIERVRQIAADYSLDFIQLHGNESPEYCAGLNGYRLIKAFNIAVADDFLKTDDYADVVDIFLFDTKGKSVGGNGVKFDWSILDSYNGQTPFLLSGGIGPDDAESVNAFHHNKCIGIDLNSRFEVSPGLKDINKLRTFIQKLDRQ